MSAPQPELTDLELERAEETATDDADVPRRKGWGVGFWLAVTWTVLILGLSALAPWLPFVDSPGAFGDFSVEPSAGPSADHWFGVNDNGVDLFSQVVWGGRVSLFISLSVVVIGFLLGGLIGMTAGFLRGRVDRVVSAVIDVLLAFPALVLALAVVAIFASDGNAVRPTIPVIILSLAILSVAPLARITRGVTLAFSEREFVTAARTLGAKSTRILRREILPNVVPPMAAFSLVVIAVVIVAEGALAFLGLSVSAPAPTWGKLIATGRLNMEASPHLVYFPAGVMFLTILSLNYIGDVLQGKMSVREGVL
ncbi:MAG: ABC transporter permease [Acidimicrobiales bacterium]|nr:ABC transporter permease [Acidimicrobiales bacterium]